METGGFCTGVPTDDLSALKGCVSRNRVLFSPTSLVGKASIQTRAIKTTGTWPDLISSSQGSGRTTRHRSPETLSPSEPNLHRLADMPFSVSIQFAKERNKGHLHVEQKSPASASLPRKGYKHECAYLPSSKKPLHLNMPSSLSIPSGLNTQSLKSCSAMDRLGHKSCCVASTSERIVQESQHMLNVPFSRTNSLDGQRPASFNCFKTHAKECCLGDTASSYGSEHSLFSSTCTFQEISSKSHYVKGVDGQVFKTRMETIQKWFSESNDHQKNKMLLNLLDQCNCAQLHLLSIHMEPILHGLCPLNCHDLLSWLPSNLAFYILSFLDPVSLCRASQVCRIWFHMANDCRLWMKLCRLCVWQLSQTGEEKQRDKHISTDGRILWKAMFSERFRIRRNWLKGFCNVRTFEGHTQGISCIQFDETRIVSGSWDKTIKSEAVQHQRKNHYFKWGGQCSLSLLWLLSDSACGPWSSATRLGVFRAKPTDVWNRRTNTAWAALTLTGHSGTVRCLHLHHNRLVSGSSDRTIKVWELSTENINWVGATCRITMVGHMHTVRCLQADNEKVISGSYDNTLKVWDLSTGMCSLTLRGHGDAVLCLHFHGNKLVSGSKDTTIKVWHLPEGYCQLTLHGHQAPVTCVQFDDTRVISGAVDRLIKIWSLETGQCIRTIDWIRSEGHTGVIRHLQADGWKIVSAADDKTLKVWSLTTGDRLLTLKSHTDGVTCLQFNDEVIVSGSYDKTVKLWDFSVC